MQWTRNCRVVCLQRDFMHADKMVLILNSASIRQKISPFRICTGIVHTELGEISKDISLVSVHVRVLRVLHFTCDANRVHHLIPTQIFTVERSTVSAPRYHNSLFSKFYKLLGSNRAQIQI